MAIRSRSSTFVRCNIPADDFSAGDVAERLQKGAFRPAGDADAIAAGFVTWDDPYGVVFGDLSFQKGEHRAFGFRLDQKRVPASVRRVEIRQAQFAFREREGHWPSRTDRRAIDEAVGEALLARAFAVPTSFDVLWTPGREMLVGTNNWKALALFLDHFKGHFGWTPIPSMHATWAERLLAKEPELLRSLGRLVPLGRPGFAFIEDGRFLGYEFLTWLWYVVDRKKIQIVNDMELGCRLALTLPGQPRERVTVCTESNGLSAARAALSRDFLVSEANLWFKLGENEHTVTLDSSLSSVKALTKPAFSKIDDDENPDAVFYELMGYLEPSLQLLDNVYLEFLRERLGPTWEQSIRSIMAEWARAKEAA